MSDATEDDLKAYLDQQCAELEDAILKAREACMATLSAKGLLNSGAAIEKGVAALENEVSEHLTKTMMVADRWSGPNLSQNRARELVASYMRSILDRFIQNDYAYRMGSRLAGSASIERAFDNLIGQLKAKLMARVREFELGAEKDPDHIHALLQKLIEEIQALPQGLAERISPDAETIRSQLRKAEPSRPIIRQAGQSIRSILEGAAGGAMGNALSPSAIKTLELLFRALGIG